MGTCQASEFEYHVLTGDHVDDLQSLLAVFADAFDMEAEYLQKQPDKSYLKNLLSSSTFICVVAKRQEEIIGGCCAYVLPKFEQKRAEIYLYDLAVKQDFRRMGVATAVIDRLRFHAQKYGAYVIFVQADEGDEVAQSVYRSLGTEEKVFHFDIKV